MPEKISLTIESPCEQSLTGMSSVPGGKYCQSCQQVVHDFTGFTDKELFELFMLAIAGSLSVRYGYDLLGLFR